MPDPVKPRRSALFLPGANGRAIAKAKSIAADVLIFDLEDAVAPERKPQARASVAEAVAEGGFERREVVIRINGFDTPWVAADIAAAVAAEPDAVLLPKVGRSDDVRRMRAALAAAGAPERLQVWAMMETPLAMLNAGAIAAAAVEEGAPFTTLVMGTNDLATDANMRPVMGRAPLIPWIATCVAAARAFDLTLLDGVYNDFRDEEGFVAECEQGRDMGLDGKTLIHPDQVAGCNAVFSPSPDEVAWASTVIAAFDRRENAEKGVISIDGNMVERLHLRQARRTIEIAKAIRALDTA